MGRFPCGRAGIDEAKRVTLMNRHRILLVALLLAVSILASSAMGVTRYVSRDNASPAPPYTNWATAATSIQDAIDAATDGDTILVTNGVYDTGGRVVYGAMTNRVAIAKPVTVRSMNGPGVTVIKGNGPRGNAAVRCVYVGTNATLAGFLLTNGNTKTSGNYDREQSGGGAWCEDSGVLSNCTLSGNSAGWDGGGAYEGTLNNCTLSGNSADLFGGGAAWSTLNNCTLTGNSAGGGGGGACGGTLNNCTLSGNSAGDSGGGAWEGTLNNCIVYYNTSPVGPNYDGGSLSYCCTTPHPGGTGNIANEPALASLSHLSAGSPCIGIGNGSYVTGVDIDGEAWRNPPSMGCDEVNGGSVTGNLQVSIGANYNNVAAGFAVTFTAYVDGRTTDSVWDFGDSALAVSNRPIVAHAFAAPGSYDVTLRACNESYPGGIAATVRIEVAGTVIHYVRLDSPAPASPYTSWATAATNIQDAIDAASQVGALVLVSNGVYGIGGRVVYGGMTNRVVIDKPLTVRSMNGPEVTAIKGNGPLSDIAVRCVYVGANATLAGFLLTNGNTYGWGTGDSAMEQSGGGAWCEASGVLSNCILSGNSASENGGGAYYGTLNNCTLSSNSAYSGGGAYGATLNNCTLSGNSASSGAGAFYGTLSNCTLSDNVAGYGGGGAYYGTLNNCTLSGNSAGDYGGGAYTGTLNNCTLSGNSAGDSGGGAFHGTLNNCTLSGNSAGDSGGGAERSTLNNCTLSGNSAGAGGGACYGTLSNCVVYFNTAFEGSNYHSGHLSYCCTMPRPVGTGNITNAPGFIAPSSGYGTNHVSGNYRLLATSPCIDRGTNIWTAGAVDLDGNPRVVNWIPDMGAYEYQGIVNPDTDGDGIPNAWEGPHGLNPAVSNAPTANADGDSHTDWQEYVADTHPTNALDYLRLLDIRGEPSPAMTVSFTSSTNRFYMLQYSTNLVSEVWTNVPGQDPRLGVGGIDYMQDTNAPPEAPARFYRIEATLP